MASLSSDHMEFKLEEKRYNIFQRLEGKEKSVSVTFLHAPRRLRPAIACSAKPVAWLISRVQCLLGQAKLHLNKRICVKVGFNHENKL